MFGLISWTSLYVLELEAYMVSNSVFLQFIIY